MKVSYNDLRKIIAKLDWSPVDLASKLSIIGHEAEVLSDDVIDVKLTSNRKDCHDLNFLAFDLVALYDELGSNKEFISYKPAKPIDITLVKINKILGSNVSEKEYKKIERLGFIVNNDSVTPPDFRKDIFEGADIAEEVFRIVGPDALKLKMLDKQNEVKSSQFEFLNNLRTTLVEIGATETRSISFSRTGKVKIDNPFSAGVPFMRDTLLYGLLETVSKNPYLRRSYFYEIGNVFKPKESTKLGIILTGNKNPQELVAQLEKSLGVNVIFSNVENELLEQFSVKQPNAIFVELDINDIKLSDKNIYKSNGLPTYKKISKFPPLVRDISVPTTSEHEVLHRIKNDFNNLHILEQVDSYMNPKTNFTTNTYRLIFQNHKDSFTNDQIKEVDDKLAALL